MERTSVTMSVASEAYRAAREHVLNAEAELRDQVERVATMRHALPAGPIVPDYEFFDGPTRVRLGTPPEVPPPTPSSVALSASPANAQNPWSIVLEMPVVGTTFDDLEKEILAQVLARADGNQSRAARSLGLSESTLRSRLKRLGLKGGAT